MPERIRQVVALLKALHNFYLKAALDVALGEADTFGDADGLIEPFGAADTLADALADGLGSRLGSADGIIDAVAIGDGLIPIVDWYLFRSQTR